MGSIGTAIQPAYISLLSDISGSAQAAQTSTPPLGFFDQIMSDAVASATAASVQTQGANAAISPNTLQVSFDTTPGALYGRPIAPAGASETGAWAVLPDGSYFSDADVSASELATLHAPPASWQDTPTGETLTSPVGTADDANTAPDGQGAGVSAPRTLQVEFDTNPGPFQGRPIAPEGSSDIGQWTVLADGSYFSASDVSADGLATLHPPPDGWQDTLTGQTLRSPTGTSPAGIAA